MSVNESTESTETLYQTPDSIVIEERSTHEELEPLVSEELGASPEVSGPVTRSGKKRKNSAPVKSTGKKKNKTMNTMRSPQTRRSVDDQTQVPPPAVLDPPSGPHTNNQPTSSQPDIAALLTSGLSSIQQSMSGMESRLGGKIDTLEAAVATNKESIAVLTESLNKNTIDLARLESQMRDSEGNFYKRVTNIVRTVIGRESLSGHHSVLDSSSASSSSSRRLSQAQVDRYMLCRRSLRLWPIEGPDVRASVLEFQTDIFNLMPDRSSAILNR